MNLIEAAHDAGVRRVVGLSTDKALNPQSAYGASKLLMEKMLLAANNARGDHGPMFACTRFGNIIGSRGSVVDVWRSQPLVRLTDPRCTRYWLTEANAMAIIWAALMMMPTEPLVPVARAFNLADLAEAMDKPVELVGLRAGEALHEEMREGESSETAPRMTIDELREALRDIA